MGFLFSKPVCNNDPIELVVSARVGANGRIDDHAQSQVRLQPWPKPRTRPSHLSLENKKILEPQLQSHLIDPLPDRYGKI